MSHRSPTNQVASTDQWQETGRWVYAVVIWQGSIFCLWRKPAPGSKVRDNWVTAQTPKIVQHHKETPGKNLEQITTCSVMCSCTHCSEAVHSASFCRDLMHYTFYCSILQWHQNCTASCSQQSRGTGEEKCWGKKETMWENFTNACFFDAVQYC